MPEDSDSKPERALIIAGPELSTTLLDSMVEGARRAAVSCIAVEPTHIQHVRDLLINTKVNVYALISYPHGLTRPEIVHQSLKWCKTQGASGVLAGFPVGVLLSDEQQLVEALLKSICEELDPKDVFHHCSIQGLSIEQVLRVVEFIKAHGFFNIQVPPEAVASGWVDPINNSVEGICLSIGPIHEPLKRTDASRYWFDGSSIHNQNLSRLLEIEE